MPVRMWGNGLSPAPGGRANYNSHFGEQYSSEIFHPKHNLRETLARDQGGT